MGVSELQRVGTVTREVVWYTNWDGFAYSEVKHLGSDSDERLRPLEVATIVEYILNQFVGLTVEWVYPVSGLYRTWESSSIELVVKRKYKVIRRCGSRWVLLTGFHTELGWQQTVLTLKGRITKGKILSIKS